MAADIQVLPVRPRHVPSPIESEVIGMLILVVSEMMFFAGLLSAYSIIKSRTPAGYWPPPGDPPLPALETGVVTLLLLVSAVLVAMTARPAWRPRATSLLTASAALGAVFVVFQVAEFAQLVGEGLTMVSSAHGGFVYTIVGAHALHCVVAVLVLSWATARLRAGALSEPLFAAIRIFWYFVVGLWPVLFGVVYL